MLTDTQVKRAASKDKPYKLKDGNGLFIHVMASGKKYWRYRYDWDGKEKTLTLGEYPDVSVAAAREARAKARAALNSGSNPAVIAKLDKIRSAHSAAATFEGMAREWHDLQKHGWVDHHAKDVLSSLESYVFPSIGVIPIDELEPMVIWSLLKAIQDRSALETAHRVRQRISMVFKFAIATGRAKSDPAGHLTKLLKPIRKGRQPAVTSLEDARQVLLRAEATAASPVTKLAHRLLALTAVRPGVIAECPWEELRDTDGSWVVPAQRMKLRKQYKDDAQRDHHVPLPSQALACIDAVRRITGRSTYVFPNDRWFHKPMSENAMSFLLKRAGFQGRHVPHGWRATFSTVMNERRPEYRAIIDMMLAHVPKDPVEAAYNRARHMELRLKLAQEWADLLMEGLPEPMSLLESHHRKNAA